MPRRSAASLAIAPIRPPKHRLDPPRGLSKGASAVFRAIVSAVDAEHFSPADLPLLTEYARAADLANRAAAELDKHGAVTDGKASAWLVVQEKSVRALTALAARLRICPQSRFDRTVAGTKARNSQPVIDWESYFARQAHE